MIGDNPEADVRGAEAAGIPAILVRSDDDGVARRFLTTGWRPVVPDVTIGVSSSLLLLCRGAIKEVWFLCHISRKGTCA